MSLEVTKILSMQGGNRHGSYPNHSSVQNHTFHSFVKQDLTRLLQLHFQHLVPAHLGFGRAFCVADFGCSHGRNTLDYADAIAGILRGMYGSSWIPEIHYFFNDLPANDFNSLFRLLEEHNITGKANDAEKTSYFSAGVPGSFFGRLFPEQSLHLGISAYALHWLSQIPRSVVDKSSPLWNGGHSWINKDRPMVDDAFGDQFKKDLTSFLTCRAKELASGALLYLLFFGRPETIPAGEYLEHSTPWSYEFEATWADMVSQGLVDINHRDTFNIPVYYPCLSEVEEVVNIIPELRLLELSLAEDIPVLSTQQLERVKSDAKDMSKFIGGNARSVSNSLVEAQIGPELSKHFFDSVERKLEERAHVERRWSLDFVRAVLIKND